MATVGHDCRLTVEASTGGRSGSAVTHFRADRIDSLGHYIRGREEGGIVGPSVEGTYVIDDEMVEAADGTFRAPRPADPPEKRLRITRTFSLSPRGHCTFFHGVVRAIGSNTVIRHYAWGYPRGVVMERETPATPPSAEDPPRKGKL